MFDKWRRYSYTAQKKQRYRLLRFFLVFLILYVLYNLLTTFFISVWTLENDTMQSGMQAGDRLVFSSFSLSGVMADIKQGRRTLPYKRGNIVLIDAAQDEKQKKTMAVLDGIVRFFTVQRVSLFNKDNSLFLKRLIGLPGDEVSMNNYVFKVRPAGEFYSLTEFEHSEKPYNPLVPQIPDLWDESIPFSGTMENLVLGPDEYFVVSDDRSNTNDSRTWGPVSPDMIKARAIFRFWPPSRIGKP